MNAQELLKFRALGSLLFFTRLFYKERTSREFIVSQPVSRESHHITICKELTNVFHQKTQRLLINVPPGHGKSEMCINFVAWALAHYPDSQFLYISFSHDLAAKHTYAIKEIIELPLYKKLFGIEIRSDSKARDNFMTNAGGAIKAFGSGGTITGMNAGLPGVGRFSGAIIMDDMHKPDEVHSDSMRDGVIRNYNETIKYRARSSTIPYLFIGQCLHEVDLPAYLKAKKDGYEWKEVILKSIDEAGNALYPEVFPLEMLLIEQEFNPYAFAAQHQQSPQPAGGGIFKPEWFVHLDDEPSMIATFITIDTAETDKNYNDATVFSFWGVYLIEEAGVSTKLFGLHWIDCVELRVEPKDLENEFRFFYSNCLHYPMQPRLCGVEKKSTGVTLLSVLDGFRGMQILDIPRTKASGSKTTRYLEMQSLISSKRISFRKFAKHADMCITQAKKITANNTHAHDDIIDTLYDAVKIALIKEYFSHVIDTKESVTLPVFQQHNHINSLRKKSYERRI